MRVNKKKETVMTLGPDRNTFRRWYLKPDDGSEGGNNADDAATTTPKPDAAKPTDSAGKTEDKAKAVTVEIEGKKYVLQDHVNELVGTARTEGNKTGRKEVEDEARAKLLEEQGDFKALYEAEKEKAEKAATELATERLASLKRTIGAKHNLPAKLIDRLTGTTEKEIDADAKALAEELSVSKPAADTESGKSSRTKSGTGTQQTTGRARPFAFQKEGDVTWNRPVQSE